MEARKNEDMLIGKALCDRKTGYAHVIHSHSEKGDQCALNAGQNNRAFVFKKDEVLTMVKGKEVRGFKIA